ncbi:MAG TPA: DUF4190 domain-containing protein [Ktedonobacterales bacterium]|jgi:hypothetical protein
MTNPSPYGDYSGYPPPPPGASGQTPYEPYPQGQPAYPSPGQEQQYQQGQTGYPPPPPGYQQSPYATSYQQPYAPPGAGYAPAGPTSGMAIASLVCSLLGIGLVGVILGHLALNEINKSNGYTQGRGLAIAGLIIGYLQIAAVVIFLIFVVLGVLFAASTPGVPS